MKEYQKVASLGKGAFAEVFEAIDYSHSGEGARCAVKGIGVHCESEILIHRRLRHNNIVQLYKVIQLKDINYLILELCQGGNLNQLLAKEKQAKWNRLTTTTNRANINLSTQLPTTTTTTTNGSNGTKLINFNLDATIFPIATTTTTTNHASPTGILTTQSKRSRRSTTPNDYNSHHPSPVIPAFDYDIIRSIIRQLCDALVYLHRNNIIHRDVNLNNLLIASPLPDEYTADDIHIKLADFGLAIDLSSRYNSNDSYLNITNVRFCNTNKFATSTPRHPARYQPFGPEGNTLCGTPGFIAPEVIKGQQFASPSNDAYSVGSVLHALVTGCVPNGSQLQLSKVPPILVDLITSLLQENPSNRLSIEDILKHPFMIGPIVAIRLPCNMIQRTNTMEYIIGPDGSPMIRSLVNKTSIETSPDGSEIIIVDKSGRSYQYTLDTLPKVHWKKYHSLSTFVDLVKSKEVKVSLYCNQIIPDGLLIEKCCLMENGSIEVTVSDPNNSLKKPRIILFEKTEASFDNPYVSADNMKAVCTRIRELERGLDRQAKQSPNLALSLFPAKFGQRPTKTRSFSSSIESKRNFRQDVNASIDYGNLSISRPLKIKHREVESARQSDGYLEFSFIDGGNMKIFVYKNELIYNNSKGLDYCCKVDLSRAADIGLPPELKAKLEIIYPYISRLTKDRK